MLKKPVLWVAIAAAMLLSVACSSTAAPTAPPVPTDEAAPAQEEAAEVLPEVAEESSPEVVEEAVEEPEQPAADASNVEVLHRANPAPPDSFVADTPEWVAATGRPQLIEFFAYW